MPAACTQAKLRLTRRQRQQLAARGRNNAALALLQAQGCADIACALQVCHHLPSSANLELSKFAV